MKKNLILVVIMFLGISFRADAQLIKKLKNKAGEMMPDKKNSSPDQPGSNDKPASADHGHVKYKLRDGETLLIGEECVFFNGSFEQFQFITKMDGKFYFHNHDRISGPFDKPPIDSLKDCEEKQNQNLNKEPDQKVSLAKYQTMDVNSTIPFGLKIGGKSYGPYSQILNLHVSRDESKFYAFTMLLSANGENMDYYLVSHLGKMKLPGMVVSWLISPNSEHCAIPFSEAQLKGNQDTQIDPSAPVYLLYTDGRKNGPINDFYADQHAFLTNSGKYVQLKYSDRKTLFVDGKPALKFSKEIMHFDAVILNDNTTGGVYFDNGTLEFTDGTIIANEAIRPHLFRENGKSFVRWMAIDKQGNIYECKKEI
jgi:hypothetical protein